MDNLIGRDLGRYHIVEQLGEGGMATVYKAYDVRLERDVAVKIIRTDQFAPAILELVLKRFEREAKALARLIHPNIVHVNDFGEEKGIPYLVMDYLPGKTLKQRLGKPLPWEEAVRLLLPIARALEYAHEHNIIHRDIKPSNILLTEKGQPMLSDFGIAKILEDEGAATLTGTGVTIGTPEYMAPEQWTGQASFPSDLYSLGVVLYELVTGRKPYIADTPAAILLKQASEPLPRPTLFVPDLPESVEKILFKALAKKPEDRYQNMGLMAAALEGLLAGQTLPEASIEEATRLVVQPAAEVPETQPAEAGQPSEAESLPQPAAPPALEPEGTKTLDAGMAGKEPPPGPAPQIPPASAPERTKTMDAGMAGMERLPGPPAQVPPVPPSTGQPAKAPKRPRRWMGWVIAAIVIVFLVVAGLATGFFALIGKPATPASTPTIIPTDTNMGPIIYPSATLPPVPINTPVVSAENLCDTAPLGCVRIGPTDPIHIAYLLVVSGPNAALGTDARNGVEIAIDDAGGKILGHPIKFDGQDGGCSADGGQAAGAKLASDPTIVAVIGTSCSSEARAAEPLLSKAGFVTISPSNTAPDLTDPTNPNHYPGYFRTAHNDKVQGKAAADFVYNFLHLKTAATIHDGSLYASSLVQVFADNFKTFGGTITTATSVDPNATDMSSVLASIATAKPDIIYYPIFLPAGAFITVQAKTTSGLENTKLMSADGLYSPDAMKAAGAAAEGWMVSSPVVQGPAYDAFVAKYKAKFGELPINIFHAHAYDAFNIVIAAIQKVAVQEKDGTIYIPRQGLRDAVAATKDFKGLTGVLTCSVNGDCANPIIGAYVYHAGQYPPELIWPK